jgi:signal transduction histidine kinase
VHPVFEAPRRLRWHFVSWAVAGVVLGLIVRGMSHAGWLAATAFGLPMGLLAGSMALSAWYVSRAAPAGRTSAGRVAATVLVAALVVAAIWAAAGQLWWQALEAFGLMARGARPPGFYELLLLVGGLTYLVSVMGHFVWHAFEDSAASRRRAFESQIAHRDAELRALRAQVDPHFLFNSLNAISGLIGADPAQARLTCQRLADFLRESLAQGRATSIPLAREVALVEQYLQVEQVRFGARLQVRVAVPDDCRDVPVPPLLLQPLVENAVRHGVATTLDGGLIEIEVRRAGARAVIVVSNPRDPDRERRGTGFGLEIVGRRLDAAFGGRAALFVDPGAGTFRVTVTVPIEESA